MHSIRLSLLWNVRWMILCSCIEFLSSNHLKQKQHVSDTQLLLYKQLKWNGAGIYGQSPVHTEDSSVGCVVVVWCTILYYIYHTMVHHIVSGRCHVNRLPDYLRPQSLLTAAHCNGTPLSSWLLFLFSRWFPHTLGSHHQLCHHKLGISAAGRSRSRAGISERECIHCIGTIKFFPAISVKCLIGHCFVSDQDSGFILILSICSIKRRSHTKSKVLKPLSPTQSKQICTQCSMTFESEK